MDFAAQTLTGISAQGAQVPAPRAGNDHASARRAAEEFESFFLSQIIGSMFENMPTNGTFDGGPSESIYRSMMGEQFGRAAARAGGVGIANAVYREMIKLQEAKAP